MHPVLSVASTIPAIATGFVRKLYRILDQDHVDVISWDPSGLSFSIHDEVELEDHVLPQYFRGRLDAFRQQLKDHGFAKSLQKCSEVHYTLPIRETYHHPHFVRRCPEQLCRIVYVPTPRRRLRARKAKANPTVKRTLTRKNTKTSSNPLFSDDLDLSVWLSVSALDTSPRGVETSLSHYPDTDCEEMKEDLVNGNGIPICSPRLCVMNLQDETFSNLNIDCSAGFGFDGSSPFSDDTINWMMASWDLSADST